MDDGDKHQVKTIPHMTLWIRGAKKRHYLLVFIFDYSKHIYIYDPSPTCPIDCYLKSSEQYFNYIHESQ